MRKALLAALLGLGIVAATAGPTPAHAVGTCAILRSWSDGDTITGTLYTADLTHIMNSMTPACVDDLSPTVGEMQITVSPGLVGTEVQATSLAGEIHRLRYLFASLCTWPQWYAYDQNCNFGARALSMTGSLSANSLVSASTISAVTAITAATVTTSGNIIANGQLGTDNLVVGLGSGAQITKILGGSASLNFTALAANTCETLTITVTGAADGDPVSLGVPTALADVDGAVESTSFFGWVSAANTVSVRRCNPTGTVTADPAAATVKALVTKF